MAFLSSFKKDIFISYARVDDKIPGREKGWVGYFQEYLETELSKRFGRFGMVEVWRDTRELSGNMFFDDEIEASIKGSGIFLALISKGYLSDEGYCSKELKWFYEKAQREPYGLKIGSHSRLFVLFLQNIPYQDLPKELAGTSGFPFHDAQGSHQIGYALRQDSLPFEEQIRKLVDAIELTLRDFQKTVAPKTPEPPEKTELKEDSFPVFMAHAEGPLLAVRKRVIEGLRQSNIDVVLGIPPPFDAQAHEEKVISEMSKAKLSVHLLDDSPGIEIADEAGKTYYQKQVELGRQYAKSQWIWVPRALNIEAIEDENRKDFLQRLENGDRLASDKETMKPVPYRFIRESSGSITREVLAEIEKLKEATEKPAPPSSAALLDTHLKDQLHAWDLSRFILQRQMRAFINPEEDDPQKNASLFQEMLKRVNVLIIIFGEVADAWVRERLNCALQIAIAEKYPLKLCGIYMAPVANQTTSRQVSLGVFPVSIPVFLFDKPEALDNLLDKFVGGSE
jgi:hypothetical protein